MKYMHFKASCSYTALADLLEQERINADDYNIALEIGLPWIFAKDGDDYITGPMLQGAKWFDLWLSPRGFTFREDTVETGALPEALKHSSPCMFGMQTPYGKHAVVFTSYDGSFHLLNPTYENSGEATELVMSARELTAAAGGPVILGRLQRTAPRDVDLRAVWAASIPILRQNVAEISVFASAPHSPEAYTAALNRLFRPLLLDGITMLELVGEANLAEQFRSLQGELMAFLRTERGGPLSDTLSISTLHKLEKVYEQLITKKLA